MSSARAACMLGAGLTLTLVLAPGRALADGSESAVVELEVDDCLGAASADVKKLVALELAPGLRVTSHHDEEADAAVLRVRAQCQPEGVFVTVSEGAGQPPLTLRIDLEAAAPKARQRLLALAIAELVTTRQLNAAAVSVEEMAPQHDAASPAATDTATDTARARLQLWAMPALWLAAAPLVPLPGGSVGASQGLGRLLAWLELQALFGENARASADVDVRLLSAALGLAFAVLDRGLPAAVTGTQLSVGAGMRVGHATLQARSTRDDLRADSLAGVWVGPLAQLALTLPVVGTTSMRVALEAGYVLRPVVGRDELDRERLALRGPWLGIALGAQLSLL